MRAAGFISSVYSVLILPFKAYGSADRVERDVAAADIPPVGRYELIRHAHVEGLLRMRLAYRYIDAERGLQIKVLAARDETVANLEILVAEHERRPDLHIDEKRRTHRPGIIADVETEVGEERQKDGCRGIVVAEMWVVPAVRGSCLFGTVGSKHHVEADADTHIEPVAVAESLGSAHAEHVGSILAYAARKARIDISLIVERTLKGRLDEARQLIGDLVELG